MFSDRLKNTLGCFGLYHMDKLSEPSVKKIENSIKLWSPFPAQAKDSQQVPLKDIVSSSSPRQLITPKDLINQKANQNKVNEVRTPFANNLTLIRDGDHIKHGSGAEFAEFITQTRQHLRELAELPAGKRLFHTLDFMLDGTTSMPHKVQIQDAGKDPGIREVTKVADSEQAFSRLSEDGKYLYSGMGSSSVISHHTDYTQHRLHEFTGGQPVYNQKAILGVSDSLVLGHELIHASHAAQGFMASGVAFNGIPNEESQTVGSVDGAEPMIPLTTENKLRQDMNEHTFKDANTVQSIQAREMYGGQKIY